ncbi:Similar to Uncharacterized protein KIAA2013 homolog (Xenopus tropicalis) [Cotesia congregata]|uniref:Similar to Uncharacterized protein KIAA2013 homolog (Xenopus tropicalis) n=1 Tax=Cotesia congregata TaxID=51543 RepID=A0A8J2HD99_COTCN|nr:Similar to Uncharacterized protein KIAA2013 homolog (Xenopus tropicalis) [Cotesia congregata]
MMRNGGIYEFGKRLRSNSINRRIFIFLILFCLFLLYFGSSLAQWFFNDKTPIKAFEDICLEEKLSSAYAEARVYDAAITEHTSDDETSSSSSLSAPLLSFDDKYLPYIGNGLFGVEINPNNARVFIKHGRTLSLNIQWDPLVTITTDNNNQRVADVIHFTQGIVSRYQCIREGYSISHKYYVHQVLDKILVQDVTITNPSSLAQSGSNYKYMVTSGFVPSSNSEKIIVVTIVYVVPSKYLSIKPKSTTKLEFLTSICYSEPVALGQYENERKNTERKALKALKDAVSIQLQEGLLNQHVNTWQSYWNTGFSISDSKAKGAINGHKINSTIYYVLSQIPRGTPNIEKSMPNNEGCYRGHHTLDAINLWKDTSTIDGINSVVKAWIITLEKQGCHHLLAGPSSVQQAIVLSLGGLRFSNQHLDFNIDPQYLHRNYLFRRISYGNITHVNISVTVGNDNRAILSVALDRSDSDYYACDAGCLDSPVLLSQSYTNFPVKLTKPLTSILYITSDYQHMQDLRNALHVHEVEEAPAHDHHVMALHKHGHQLGGLPTFFWVSICFLIIVFHMFLCKLIFTEYYGRQDRQRGRYNKP